MHISDEERQRLVNLVAELREIAQNERQAGDLRRQQNAVKARFYGHAEAYEDAAQRLAAIVGEPDQADSDDAMLLNDGKSDDVDAE